MDEPRQSYMVADSYVAPDPDGEEERPSKSGPSKSGRSLTAREQNNLMQVVRTDFWALTQATSDTLAARMTKLRNEINEQFDNDPKLIAARKKLESAAKKANKILEKATAEVAATGVTSVDGGLPGPNSHFAEVRPYTNFYQPERQEALTAQDRQWKAASAKINAVIQAKKTEIDRSILLAGAGGSSVQDIITSVPKAEDLLALLADDENLRVLGVTE